MKNKIALLLLLATGMSRAADYPAQMAQAHQHDTPRASPAATRTLEHAVSGADVVYGESGGKALGGYLAFPVDAYAGRPGVLVFHEWWGLNDNIRAMTRQIAALGYAALAVDLYDGTVADTPDAAQAAMRGAIAGGKAIDEKIDKAYAYLKTSLHAPKVATLGWCFGGAMSYEAGRELDGKLAAVVIYYGMVSSDPKELANLTAPVLGLFGGADQHITPASAQAFADAMKKLGRSVDLHIYPGAQHAFANPSGQAYQQEAAEDAWLRTIAFLARYLHH
jgi:carboxymethylenebutenolidase